VSETKDTLETWKSGVELCKALAIALLLAVIVFFPRVIPFWMDKAGIDKFEFVGLEWERNLKNTDSAVLQLQSAITQKLKPQLLDSQAELCGLLALIATTQSQLTPPVRIELPKGNCSRLFF